MRCTGLSECSAPWKTIDASAQRTARSRPNDMVSTSSPSSRTRPVDRRRRGQQPQHRGRQRRLAAADSPATPSVWPGVDGRGHPAHGGHRRPSRGAVGDRRGRSSSQQASRQRASSRGSRTFSSARPTRVNASTTTTMQMPGRQQVPPGAGADRAGVERVVEHRAPGDRGRVAEAEEGQRRLGRGSRSRRSASCWRAPAASRWAARAGTSGASGRRRAPGPARGRAGPRRPGSGPAPAGRCPARR